MLMIASVSAEVAGVRALSRSDLAFQHLFQDVRRMLERKV